MSGAPPQTILVLSQVYPPDPASVGQHMADAAAELARRGHGVSVLTANRGYDNPEDRYPAHERLDGVDVVRLPFCSFGKRSILIRLLGGFSFVVQAIFRSFALRQVDAVLVSTSPPMASLAALIIARLRSARIIYWVMDLNPDQMVALGLIKPTALPVRLFDALNRAILRRAREVIVLDRFMVERVNAKQDVSSKLTVLPPWPHEDHLDPVEAAENPFRRDHGLEGKFVVMYSGNHGPSSPISTLLRALERIEDEPRLIGLFVGGGVGKQEVEAVQSSRIRSLPYQPLSELRYSLSSADVHLVTVGDAVVGIVHPSKVYGAMAVGRPILLLGPRECHVTDIIREADIGWQIDHGDIDGAEALLRRLLATPPEELKAKGERARQLVRQRLSKARLCGAFCDLVDGTARRERDA
ncbi:MAG: glycosyltransferase family 4 protein [Gemmatimonadota bacterium]